MQTVNIPLAASLEDKDNAGTSFVEFPLLCSSALARWYLRAEFSAVLAPQLPPQFLDVLLVAFCLASAVD